MVRTRKLADGPKKSVNRPENRAFLDILRTLRLKANLEQSELGERLGRNQSFVTSAERGVIRLDGLQIRDWCLACNSNLVVWARSVEKVLAASNDTTPRRGG